jgi:hypothetical protein
MTGFVNAVTFSMLGANLRSTFLPEMMPSGRNESSARATILQLPPDT